MLSSTDIQDRSQLHPLPPRPTLAHARRRDHRPLPPPTPHPIRNQHRDRGPRAGTPARLPLALPVRRHGRQTPRGASHGPRRTNTPRTGGRRRGSGYLRRGECAPAGARGRRPDRLQGRRGEHGRCAEDAAGGGHQVGPVGVTGVSTGLVYWGRWTANHSAQDELRCIRKKNSQGNTHSTKKKKERKKGTTRCQTNYTLLI